MSIAQGWDRQPKAPGSGEGAVGRAGLGAVGEAAGSEQGAVLHCCIGVTSGEAM